MDAHRLATQAQLKSRLAACSFDMDANRSQLTAEVARNVRHGGGRPDTRRCRGGCSGVQRDFLALDVPLPVLLRSGVGPGSTAGIGRR